MLKKTKLPLLLLVVLLLVSLACSFSAKGSKEKNDAAEPVPTSGESGTIRTAPTKEVAGEPGSTSEGESASSESGDEVLVMNEPIYIQDDTNLVTVFMFENTDLKAGVENIEYTIIVTDADGAELATDYGWIDFIPAGGKTGAASKVYLMEGEVADNVDIEWTYYTDAKGTDDNPFTFEKERYFPDTYWDRFTAKMNNKSDTTYRDTRVDMIAYNAEGQIVGGGYTYVDFIPGNSSVGVSIEGFVSDDPVSYEFFPKYSDFLSIEGSEIYQDVSIVKTGFYYEETILGGGFQVKNNTDKAIQNTIYILTIYEADGTVGQVESGYINVLWPGEVMGVSPSWVTLSEGSAPSDFEVCVLPGDAVEDPEASNPLSVQSAEFVDDKYGDHVTVMVANSSSVDVDDPIITVLLFNANDEIIGGGYYFADTIEASGSFSYEVYVTNPAEEVPARIEVYVSRFSW